MPNRIPELLSVWREALRTLDAAPSDSGERALLEIEIARLRDLYHQLAAAAAPQTVQMQSQAADLIAETRAVISILAKVKTAEDLHEPELS